jgi:hypothetical protein
MGRKDTSAYDIYLREENGKTVVAVISSSSSSNCTCSTDYETHLSRSHHLAKKIFSLSLSLSKEQQQLAGCSTCKRRREKKPPN